MKDRKKEAKTLKRKKGFIFFKTYNKKRPTEGMGCFKKLQDGLFYFTFSEKCKMSIALPQDMKTSPSN